MCVARPQVLESTSAAAGAALISFLLTVVLPTTLEDILALLLAGALAYISLLSWPIKRGDIKRSLAERFGGVADALEGELQKELEGAGGRVFAPLRGGVHASRIARESARGRRAGE